MAWQYLGLVWFSAISVPIIQYENTKNLYLIFYSGIFKFKYVLECEGTEDKQWLWYVFVSTCALINGMKWRWKVACMKHSIECREEKRIEERKISLLKKRLTFDVFLAFESSTVSKDIQCWRVFGKKLMPLKPILI